MVLFDIVIGGLWIALVVLAVLLAAPEDSQDSYNRQI